MFSFVKAAGLGVVAALSIVATAPASSAAVLYATSVDSITPGTGVVPPRDVAANALGAPDGKFLSLGIGGSAVFSFGRNFQAPGSMIEVTWGNRSRYIETADVFGLAAGGVRTLLGQLINTTNGGVIALNFAGVFDQLEVVDTSTDPMDPREARARDGWDIDSISVTPAPIPLPAGGVLLLSALGGVALLRRRKAA